MAEYVTPARPAPPPSRMMAPERGPAGFRSRQRQRQSSARLRVRFAEAKTDEAARILRQVAADTYADPVTWARFAFEWGEGSLKGFGGLKKWQREYLRWLGKQVLERGFDGITPVAPIRKSTVSGHGVGKSALVAIIILWIMSTRPMCRGTVTATTVPQLRTKTWAELSKWHARCLYRDWFTVTSGSVLSIRHKSRPDDWFCTGQTCKAENSEAFAGQHAVTSTSFYIFDEASGVPDVIWEVAEGGLTDGEPMFLVFGNGTRNSGRFFETQHRERLRWNATGIDSREVEGANVQLFSEWATEYGEDSDFFLVRVRGRFPRASSKQLIPRDYVTLAQSRTPVVEPWQPLVIGVDPARHGDNQSVIRVRQGNDARTFETLRFRGLDSDQLAGQVAHLSNTLKPDAIFIDTGGVGGPIYDFLRRAGHPVIGVDFGGRADEPRRYRNKRTEIWARMRDWLKLAGCVDPRDRGLEQDLLSVERDFTVTNVMYLETKEQMEERGLSSPDDGDALAVTFAQPLAERGAGLGRSGPYKTRVEDEILPDYDPY